MKIGLIVNPVSGLGGTVALKGSDGADIQARAVALGAIPRAAERMAEALGVLAPRVGPDTIWLTAGGPMGADLASGLGLPGTVEIVHEPARPSAADDTGRAAVAMAQRDVDLILFAGGDGTARDMVAAIGADAPALGVPSGVKMYSAVFAVSSRAAGALAAGFLARAGGATALREVMDLDEAAYRAGAVETSIYGYLSAPETTSGLQGGKSASGVGERTEAMVIARKLRAAMQTGVGYLVGPGSTLAELKELCGGGTLIGVDLVRDGGMTARDLDGAALLREAASGPCRIVTTLIGGQGFLFGRGNRQITPDVLRAVGVGHVDVAATRAKLIGLQGRPLLVDTGDADLDNELARPVRVTTGQGEVMVRVRSASAIEENE